MPFCNKCGTEVPDNTNFCAKCGNTLQDGQASEATAPQAAASVIPQEHPNVNNTLVWILAFVPVFTPIATILLSISEIISSIITLAINIVLCYVDEGKIPKPKQDSLGLVDKPLGAPWLVPVYLYKSAKYFNHSKGYFIVWCVMFGLSLTGFWNVLIDDSKNGFIEDSKYVIMVKTGSLGTCPNYTVEKLVNSYMDKPKWKHIVSENGNNYVNISGGITYNDKPVKAMLQFLIEGNTFYYQAFEINEMPQNNLMATSLINGMCQAAAGKNEDIAKPIKASFDCSKAGTPTEKAICSDAKLAELDVKMAEDYKMFLEIFGEYMIGSKGEWIKERDKCGAKVECIKAAYEDKFNEFKAIAENQ